MSNKYIRPEVRKPEVDPDAFQRPKDCPVHRMVWWVPREDDGKQVITPLSCTSCTGLCGAPLLQVHPASRFRFALIDHCECVLFCVLFELVCELTDPGDRHGGFAPMMRSWLCK